MPKPVHIDIFMEVPVLQRDVVKKTGKNNKKTDNITPKKNQM